MEAGTFIVIGGGIAGVTCAEMLAFLNPQKSVTLVTKSLQIKSVTNLVPVSKMLFDFNVKEKKASTLTESYPNITIIHDTLVQINSMSKNIQLKSGKDMKYEYLILCMGGVPKLIPNSEHIAYILGIRDTDSVEKLQEHVQNSRRILIVGNGGIASELIHEIRNIEVVWVIKDNHISATFVDPGAAEFFQNKLASDSCTEKKTYIKRVRYAEEVGETSAAEGGAALGPDWQKNFHMVGLEKSRLITLEYCCEIESIEVEANESWPLSVHLTNGKIINCDLIVSATGVSPAANIPIDCELLRASDGGISVNEHLQTSISDIYAAGDVCTASWTPAKHWFQMRLWSQARQMGAYAAKCITSKMNHEEVIQDFCFEMFAHCTNLFGYKVALLGLYNGQTLGRNYECLVRVTPNLEYIKLVLVNGRIQGAVLIGDTGLEETIENLILNQLDVTPYGEDLLNPDIDIEDYFD